jgi:hypothetical protein
MCRVLPRTAGLGTFNRPQPSNSFAHLAASPVSAACLPAALGGSAAILSLDQCRRGSSQMRHSTGVTRERHVHLGIHATSTDRTALLILPTNALRRSLTRRGTPPATNGSPRRRYFRLARRDAHAHIRGTTGSIAATSYSQAGTTRAACFPIHRQAPTDPALPAYSPSRARLAGYWEFGGAFPCP